MDEVLGKTIESLLEIVHTYKDSQVACCHKFQIWNPITTKLGMLMPMCQVLMIMTMVNPPSVRQLLFF